jgi:uncharacterized protein (DUF885 family)
VERRRRIAYRAPFGRGGLDVTAPGIVSAGRWLRLLAVCGLFAAPSPALAADGAAPAATTPAVTMPVAGSADAQWAAHVGRFIEAYFEADPVAAIYAGRHEFDGRLPDLRADAIRRETARLDRERAATAAFDPARLSEAHRYERQHLLAVLDTELFWRRDAQWPFRNPAWYFDSLDPEIYLSKPYAPLDQRMRGYIAYARGIPAVARDMRANLRTPMPAAWVDFGYNAVAGFAEFFAQDVGPVFASVTDPAMQKELTAANAEASRAMRELADWFDSQRKHATQDYALGADLFARMLRQTESLDVPLARLEAVGRADMQRNLAELRATCAKYAPGKSLQDCVDKANAVAPEGGAVATARRQLPELRAFVLTKKLVTIPGPEEALVELAPPYNAQNFAYITTAGPFEQASVPSIYYIAPPDPRWTPEEQAKYVGGEGKLLSTSVHEVWPGHFLHFLHVNRNPSRVAQLFQGYAYTEGWAHYVEEMMRDEGLRDGAPEWRIGQLVSALLRNARYLSAVGLHTQGMSVAESEKLFIDEAFTDPGNARQQALRGTYDPAYLNYTLGKLMILKLREDWLAANPQASLRDFHDAFLSLSGPVPLVRQRLLGNDSPAL